MALDIELFHFLNNLSGKSPVFDYIVVFLAEYLPYFLVATFILILYFSSFEEVKKIKVFFIVFFSAVISRFVAVELIRSFYHRPRPPMAFEINSLFYENSWSFPSGHSAFFFAMAMAIYLYNKKWGIWFFIASIFMNISRIIAGVHYPFDILGGAIIGIISATAIFYFVERKVFNKIVK